MVCPAVFRSLSGTDRMKRHHAHKHRGWAKSHGYSSVCGIWWSFPSEFESKQAHPPQSRYPTPKPYGQFHLISNPNSGSWQFFFPAYRNAETKKATGLPVSHLNRLQKNFHAYSSVYSPLTSISRTQTSRV